MAKKKKRRRHRHPAAPPVHSAPEAARSVATGRRTTLPPQEPSERPGVPGTERMAAEPTVEPRPRRPQPRRRRRASRRPWIIAGVVLVLVVAGLVVRQVVVGDRVDAFERLAVANGCDKLRKTEGSGAGLHLTPDELRGVRYDTKPPTHGPHYGQGVVQAGVYDKPFDSTPGSPTSIYSAVHSLEHGYVIVWHDGLTQDQQDGLSRKYADENKVIVVPYTDLPAGKKIALTAWSRLDYCSKPSTAVIDSFIETFREARSAPEPKSP